MKYSLLLELFAAISLIYLAGLQIRDLIKTQKRIRKFVQKINSLNTENRLTIIKEIEKYRSKFSDWTFFVLADRYEFSKITVSCLPKLYFTKKGSRITSFVWIEVFNLISSSTLEYTVLSKYCDGQIIQLSMSEETYHFVDGIASRIEAVRLFTPFPSYAALIGVINQVVNDFELKMLNEDNKKFASFLRNERKELIHTEMHL